MQDNPAPAQRAARRFLRIMPGVPRGAGSRIARRGFCGVELCHVSADVPEYGWSAMSIKLDEQGRLPLDQVPAVLRRAKAEGWTELALIADLHQDRFARDRINELKSAGWNTAQLFVVAGVLEHLPAEFAELTGLITLDLSGNQIGDAGAPTDAAAPTFLTMTTKPSFRAEFKAGEGGKTAVYMARWVNTRGEKGPWSEVTTTTLAA